VNVGELEEVSGETIGVEEIRSAGLVGKKGNVKVLGDGEIGRAIDVKAHAFSRSAREKIEAAGGSVETIGE
jgi:large subunit ribosomal protein L15